METYQNMHPQLSKRDIAEKLKGADIGPTSQRVEIAFFFLNKREHMSADQILDGVNQDYPAVSRGTVYNALNLLVEKDLVLEVIAAPGKVFYDPNPMPHHHIYYVDRGTLVDIPPGIIQIGHIPVDMDCQIERVDVVVRARG